jgi:hypothetical protein
LQTCGTLLPLPFIGNPASPLHVPKNLPLSLEKKTVYVFPLERFVTSYCLNPLVLISAICARAQEQKESLRGLSGVSVGFQVDPKLDAGRVRDDLLARLEGADVPVLHKSRSTPALFLLVVLNSTSDGQSLFIKLALSEDVMLARRPSQHAMAATWSADLVRPDAGDKDRQREAINSVVQMFVANYKSVNPK